MVPWGILDKKSSNALDWSSSAGFALDLEPFFGDSNELGSLALDVLGLFEALLSLSPDFDDCSPRSRDFERCDKRDRSSLSRRATEGESNVESNERRFSLLDMDKDS
jgi:hypothetical protein